MHYLRHSPRASAVGCCSVCPVHVPLPPELAQPVQCLEDGFPKGNLLRVILGLGFSARLRGLRGLGGERFRGLGLVNFGVLKNWGLG